MKELQKYLGKYSNLTPPEGSKKKIFLEVVQSECGIGLQKKDITLRGGGVILSCHPTIKSEIAQCTPQVLGMLHKKHNIHIAFIR